MVEGRRGGLDTLSLRFIVAEIVLRRLSGMMYESNDTGFVIDIHVVK